MTDRTKCLDLVLLGCKGIRCCLWVSMVINECLSEVHHGNDDCYEDSHRECEYTHLVCTVDPFGSHAIWNPINKFNGVGVYHAAEVEEHSTASFNLIPFLIISCEIYIFPCLGLAAQFKINTNLDNIRFLRLCFSLNFALGINIDAIHCVSLGKLYCCLVLFTFWENRKAVIFSTPVGFGYHFPLVDRMVF